MSDEHTSLIGSAYNDGYDVGYSDGEAVGWANCVDWCRRHGYEVPPTPMAGN